MGEKHSNMFEMTIHSRPTKTKRFFDLSMEEKQLAPHPTSGQHHRGSHAPKATSVRSHIYKFLGYSAPGLEKVSQHIYDEEELAQNRVNAPDVKESFECGDEASKDMPNIWLPDDILPGFKEACLEFYWVCRLGCL